ncbi:MAG TPA: dynamin family protein [Nitriliruptorales bacterium]
MAGTTTQAAQQRELLDALERLQALAGSCDRGDLAATVASAAARLRRPSTVVAVVGQFKEGKSSLVNALVGVDACPVDDDLATAAVTLVHHAEQRTAVVRRRDEEGQPLVETVAPDRVRDLATEAGNPDNHLGVERVDLGVPSGLLADGLAFVDTPGMGTVGAGHTAATLAFLPFADALLFVTDASTELTAPELDFLHDAVARCPTVLVCLTKIDLYPSWRRIEELNRGHLDAAGIGADAVAVSARVCAVARERDDPELLDESGVPALTLRLRTDIAQTARAQATAAAAATAHSVAAQLRDAAEDELAILTDPARLEATRTQLADVRARLAELSEARSAWQLQLNDAVTDLTARTTHLLRSSTRDLARELDDHLEQLRSNDDWERLARELQARVAGVVASVFDEIAGSAAQIRDRLLATLGDEDLALPAIADRSASIDLGELWQARVGEPFTGGGRGGKEAIQGAQRGLIVLGLLGRVLPGAGATLLLSNPLLLGAGVLLAGKQFVDQRQRRLTQQRQAARTAIRQFLDDITFELGPQVAEAVRGVHRSLRDDVAGAIAELDRTYRELATRAEAAVEAGEQERATRTAELRDLLGELA